jgi:hypothetical protein
MDKTINSLAWDELQASEVWDLNADQMFFMLEHHNLILQAYEQEDMATLNQLASSAPYQKIFGAMSWDEAFDRYESSLSDEQP